MLILKRVTRCKKRKLLWLLIAVSITACLIPYYLIEKDANVSMGSSVVPFYLLETNIKVSKGRNNTPVAEALLSQPPDKKPKRIRNKHNRSRLHKQLKNLTEEEVRLENLNSIEYYACCGLGHRLTKMSDAWFISRELNLALKTFWGFCEEYTEVFSYLFGSQPLEEVKNVEPGGKLIRLRNGGLPGMVNLVRTVENKTAGITCPCDGNEDKIQHDIDYYKSLYQRFQFRDSVESFKLEHKWENHTVLGMHVRAGNGEMGDFTDKGRGIQNVQNWTRRICTKLKSMILNRNISNPMLYIATDTPAMIEYFQSGMSNIPVIDLPQERIETGVFFGEQGANAERGSKCLDGWVQAVSDMMILASSDTVIAARPSSFVQAMPQSLAFSRGHENAFCEFNLDASEMNCYDNYRQWCCTTQTKSFLGTIQNYEYIRMPKGAVNRSNFENMFTDRHKNTLVLPMHGSLSRNTDLPFVWSKLFKRSKSR
mmetsp:Transcript_2134/g.3158  ORF Transcript_2134/g.3158 Transcript_2134/m.3158 type:complete len:482 (+) Transcript_2134:97-1542(+)